MLMPNELHAEAVSGPELYRPLFPARGFPHRFVISRRGPRRGDVSCAGGMHMGEKWCSNQFRIHISLQGGLRGNRNTTRLHLPYPETAANILGRLCNSIVRGMYCNPRW